MDIKAFEQDLRDELDAWEWKSEEHKEDIVKAYRGLATEFNANFVAAELISIMSIMRAEYGE